MRNMRINQLSNTMRTAMTLLKDCSSASGCPIAMRMVIWELDKTAKKLAKLEDTMDKKMHQVTKRMKTAEHDIRKGKKGMAVKVLKKAEKKNEKLVKIDKNVRDPLIKKAKKVVAAERDMKKGQPKKAVKTLKKAMAKKSVASKKR
jgi:hypothetical protein